MNFKIITKILLIFMIIPTIISANEYKDIFKKANDSYKKGNYEKAISLYSVLEDKKIKSENLFYNMGNSYVKLEKYGYAILYYEKALYINPDNVDAIANLKLVNSKNVDKILNSSGKVEVAGVSSVYSFLRRLNPKILLISFMIIWSIFFIVLILRKLNIKILSKNMNILFITLFLILLFFNSSFLIGNYYALSKVQIGIVVENKLSVLEGPDDNYKELFLVHEGLKIQITDKRENWFEITLPNGNVGWVSKKSFKKI